jgi:hypothetical protein
MMMIMIVTKGLLVDGGAGGPSARATALNSNIQPNKKECFPVFFRNSIKRSFAFILYDLSNGICRISSIIFLSALAVQISMATKNSPNRISEDNP